MKLNTEKRTNILFVRATPTVKDWLSFVSDQTGVCVADIVEAIVLEEKEKQEKDRAYFKKLMR